ncbi:hypothetical protein HQ545_02705 [Candidatus Woesearchaeota archaeon]|nr:hypothetical protein [Candidatus Woesearchaeota archaeon]
MHDKMITGKRICTLLLIIVLAILVTEPVMAGAIGDSLRSAGNSINSFFSEYASDPNPSLIDFVIFSAIFIALCYIGFSKVFTDAKNAVTVLSISVGLALSIGLVFGGQITLKKLMPFAGIILFLIIIVLIYALMKRFVFSSDTAGSKILSAVIAIVVSILILILAWNMICANERCEGNPFARISLGSNSIIGRIIGGFDDLTEWGPDPSHVPPGRYSPGDIASCGDGRIDSNEFCDTGQRANVSEQGCNEDERCDNCARCISNSTAGTTLDFLGDNYLWIILIVLFLIVFNVIMFKNKTIRDNMDKWLRRKPHKKEIDAMNRLLGKLDRHEKQVSNNIAQLIQNIRSEKQPMDLFTTTIIDNLTKDIKDTIGGTMQQVQDAERAGLNDNINTLKNLNQSESNISRNIIADIMRQEIRDIDNEIRGYRQVYDKLNQIENVAQHFDENSRIMESFGHYNFREQGVIEKMKQELTENSAQFDNIANICDGMHTLLEKEQHIVKNIAKGRDVENYSYVVKKIKEIRGYTLKLKQLFGSKVTLLRHLVRNMEHLKQEVETLHTVEVESIKGLRDGAVRSKDAELFDQAVYFAAHVIENAHYLNHCQLDEQSRLNLQTWENEAKDVLRECLPKVIKSIAPGVVEDLWYGTALPIKKYKRAKASLKHIKTIDYINDDAKNDLRIEFTEYSRQVSALNEYVERWATAGRIRDQILRILGLIP